MVGWFPANRNKFGQYWPLPVHIFPVKCGQDSSILSPKDLLFSFSTLFPPTADQFDDVHVFSVVDLMIQTLWSFYPPLSFTLLLIICSLSFFNWDNNSRSITMGDIFLFPFLFRDIKAFTKALLKYDQNTYFQFRHLRALSLSYKHNKRYFAFFLMLFQPRITLLCNQTISWDIGVQNS